MNTDFAFCFEKATVFRGFAGLAARWAVLRPLFGKSRGRAAIVKHTWNCVAAWRARVDALVGIGARCSQRRDWQRLARNCTPAFVRGTGGYWTCNTRQICPFCYGRYVATLWPIVEAAFEGYFDMPVGTSPFWLLERRRSGQVAIEHPAVARAAYMDAVRRRRELVRQYAAIGGYACLRIVPTTQPGVWAFHNRLLLKVPAGTQRPTVLAERERVEIYPDVTRALLCAALSRTCRYPHAYLRAPVEEVTAILDALSGFRAKTSAFTGDFRTDREFQEEDQAD